MTRIYWLAGFIVLGLLVIGYIGRIALQKRSISIAIVGCTPFIVLEVSAPLILPHIGSAWRLPLMVPVLVVGLLYGANFGRIRRVLERLLNIKEPMLNIKEPTTFEEFGDKVRGLVRDYSHGFRDPAKYLRPAVVGEDRNGVLHNLEIGSPYVRVSGDLVSYDTNGIRGWLRAELPALIRKWKIVRIALVALGSSESGLGKSVGILLAEPDRYELWGAMFIPRKDGRHVLGDWDERSDPAGTLPEIDLVIEAFRKAT